MSSTATAGVINADSGWQIAIHFQIIITSNINRQPGLQNHGVEPNAVIHAFDSHGARTLENNPVTIYMMILTAVLKNICAHV